MRERQEEERGEGKVLEQQEEERGEGKRVRERQEETGNSEEEKEETRLGRESQPQTLPPSTATTAFDTPFVPRMHPCTGCASSKSGGEKREYDDTDGARCRFSLLAGKVYAPFL